MGFKALVALSNGFTSWFNIIRRYLRSSDENSSGRCYRRLLASERALNYHRKVCNKIAVKRRLFLLSTSEGVKFGTGSPATQVGDQIVLISGLSVPTLLRETEASKRYETGSKVRGKGLLRSRTGFHSIDNETRGMARMAR